MSDGMQKTKNRRHCTYLSLSQEEYLMELWWWGEEWTPDGEYWKKGGGGILSSMSPNNKDTKNSKENCKIESSGLTRGQDWTEHRVPRAAQKRTKKPRRGYSL